MLIELWSEPKVRPVKQGTLSLKSKSGTDTPPSPRSTVASRAVMDGASA